MFYQYPWYHHLYMFYRWWTDFFTIVDCGASAPSGIPDPDATAVVSDDNEIEDDEDNVDNDDNGEADVVDGTTTNGPLWWNCCCW